MKSSSAPNKKIRAETETRRPYANEFRRQQAAQTRDRILAAGARLVRTLPDWKDWRDVTMRSVAAEAGVSERTVYRHFSSERELRDAIMHHFEGLAGDPFIGLDLENLPDVTARIFGLMKAYAGAPPTGRDPTLAAINQRRHSALLAAVEASTQGWSPTDRRTAAALLDLLWSVTTYERLTLTWNLSPTQASRAITGLMRLLVDAISEGRRPWRVQSG
jgi:AcrR family transcriptional regulator